MTYLTSIPRCVSPSPVVVREGGGAQGARGLALPVASQDLPLGDVGSSPSPGIPQSPGTLPHSVRLQGHRAWQGLSPGRRPQRTVALRPSGTWPDPGSHSHPRGGGLTPEATCPVVVLRHLFQQGREALSMASWPHWAEATPPVASPETPTAPREAVRTWTSHPDE